jgi:uncharacterized protein (TIGR03067 family)
MAAQKSVLLLACVLSTGTAGRCGDPKEQDNLEGTWTFVRSAPDDEKKAKGPAVRMVLKGNSIVFETDGKKRVEGTYTVDPSKTPKTMDITLAQAKGTVLAIYELEGDALRLCHHLGPKASKERPKAFAADKQTVLGILKREKE